MAFFAAYKEGSDVGTALKVGRQSAIEVRHIRTGALSRKTA
jgi:hypothetical protein